MAFRHIAVRLAMVAVLTACSMSGSASTPTEPQQTPSVLHACPDGKPSQGGLSNFGAFIGTWQAEHLSDTNHPGAYLLVGAQGWILVRCSDSGYVISEEIHPLHQTPEGLALRLALSDIPADSKKIYDHSRRGCRTLQYQSNTLAQQLGADDRDGHVGFTFVSDGAVYNPVSVAVIRIDTFEVLGADTRQC